MGVNLTEVIAVLVKANGRWKCYKHPSYGVRRAPTSDCKACNLLWMEKESRK